MTVSSPPQPNDLTRLREAIDQVDNQLADLLLQRFAMGAAVAQAKRGQAAGLNMRPEREVEILRRLAARWQGPAPVGVMAVIWRQIISAVLQMQGPLRVVAPVLDDGAVAVLAREHFGLTVPIEAGGAPEAILAQVEADPTCVAVLPCEGDWLLRFEPGACYVVARLPFLGEGSGAKAYLVAQQAYQPTGADTGIFRTPERIFTRPLGPATDWAAFRAKGAGETFLGAFAQPLYQSATGAAISGP